MNLNEYITRICAVIMLGLTLVQAEQPQNTDNLLIAIVSQTSSGAQVALLDTSGHVIVNKVKESGNGWPTAIDERWARAAAVYVATHTRWIAPGKWAVSRRHETGGVNGMPGYGFLLARDNR
jgi:hypothetical protein